MTALYLFDTSVLGWLGRRRPLPGLEERIRSVPRAGRFAASTTVAEMLFGALVLGEQGRLILQRIERDVLPGLSVLPFDEDAARRFAETKADLHRRGEPIGDADLQIASIALAHGLIVVTANTRHFARVPGVTVENWLA